MARPRLIDREAILDAGLAIADAIGVDRLTMQAIADRLGVTPMSLYRYVADKADLLDGIVERLIDEARPPDPSSPPEEQLIAIGREIRRVARRHPTVFPLLLQRPATTPGSRRARDRVVELLEEMGIPAPDAARGERVISTLVVGFAAGEAAGRFGRHTRREIDADFALVEATVTHIVTSLATDPPRWQTDPANAIATAINSLPKYVGSNSLREADATWRGECPDTARLVTGDVAATVRALKDEPGHELQVWGSGNLLHTLLQHDLVDRFRLMTFPVVLGSGRRLFNDGIAPATMRPVELTVTDLGVVVGTYEPAGPVRHGQM